MTEFSIANKINKVINNIYLDKINEKEIEELDNYAEDEDHDDNFIIQLDFNKIPENILVKILTKQYKYDLLCLGVIYSIPYAEINYFKKIIKLIIGECNKEEKKKKFEKLIEEYKSLFLIEQIEELMVYKYKYIFDILFPEYIEKKYFDILISKNNYDKKEIIKVLTKIKLLLYQNKYKHSISTKKILLIIIKI